MEISNKPCPKQEVFGTIKEVYDRLNSKRSNYDSDLSPEDFEFTIRRIKYIEQYIEHNYNQ